MFRLHIVPAHGDPFEYVLKGDAVVVGRSSTADLNLGDRFLSRQHARLFLKDDRWFVEDLGSRNGTLVNGTRIEKPQSLKAGDELRLSGSVISIGKNKLVSPMSDSPLGDVSQHTVFRRASDLLESHSITDTADLAAAPEALRRHAEQLRLLNEVHRALGGSIELDELLELILSRAFDHLEPEEGVIFLRDDEDGYYRAAHRSLPGNTSDHLYSKTLILEVAEKGLAALVLDVETDDRFAGAQSILSSGVQSLVAAPLLDAEGSLGMIALNSRLHKRQFQESDMELLTSLASVAALRIRNVALAEEAAERRLLEEELKLARQIQVGLIPTNLPSIAGYEMRAGNVPSRGVSGDYYEVVERSEGSEVVFMVADVSGKGIAASLLTASLEALAAGPIEVGQPPQEICTRVCRRLFVRTPPAKYATVFLVVLEPETGKLTYTNAGHNSAILVRADGSCELLASNGRPIGLLAEGDYSESETHVSQGDSLVVYTDGITEAENPEEEEYGLERLVAVCTEHKAAGVDSMAKELESDLDRFAQGTPYADDRTLMIFRRLPS